MRRDGILAARRALTRGLDELLPGCEFRKDENGWLSLWQGDVLVESTYRAHRDAALLSIAREIGWSIERHARACRPENFWERYA